MPFPPWLALPWGLADTLDVAPSSLWVPLGEQHATATLLEGKVPEGGALCLSCSLLYPPALGGVLGTPTVVSGQWSTSRGKPLTIGVSILIQQLVCSVSADAVLLLLLLL